ncbi:MAG: hypothetical protein LIP28_02735 [Deltaproteobacteria bacterium]|nr:hypothetical protein [Deltaproteobacteria bacterium]
MRNKKHVTVPCPLPQKSFGKLFLPALLAGAVCLAPAAVGAADATLSTRNNESVITRDPATGDTVMKTPDAKPEQGYDGPQTIIVSPEVYPGGRPGPGGSGGHHQKPRHPQKPPHRPQPRR